MTTFVLSKGIGILRLEKRLAVARRRLAEARRMRRHAAAQTHELTVRQIEGQLARIAQES